MFEMERIQKIIKDLHQLRVTELVALEDLLYKRGDYKTPAEADRCPLAYEPFAPNDLWGDDCHRYWFKTQLSIPEGLLDQALVLQVMTGQEGQWDALNPQFLLFLDEEIIQGLDVNHREVTLSAKKTSIRVDLHSFAGMQGKPVKLQLKLGILNREIEKLIYDLQVALDAAALLDQEDPGHHFLVSHMIHAINMLYTFDVNSQAFKASVIDASAYLHDRIYGMDSLKAQLLKQGLLPEISLIGHTHIDVAWLWTLKQTREKVVRSFSTVLKLMEDYPEYQFMASQPILLQFIEEDYPALFDKIKSAARFEVEGGMWLEADCNLSSGESLIRHILHGKRYMHEKFGIDSKILWLPDVFGYSAALPQILKQFGIENFVTTKISWNEFNQMPYDTFYWKGLDGSEILSYFMTMMDYQNIEKGSFKTVYEGSIDANHMKGAWARYQQKRENQQIMVSYGYGDGGGGPTKAMLEHGRRLSHYLPGLPVAKFDNLKSYFKQLNARDVKWPKWQGELYLEYHRGTLTTMAQNKWYNRKSEILYRNLEWLSTLAKGYDIPYDRALIKAGWEKILLNQFHDIIPGTSIKAVYEESHLQYDQLMQKGQEHLENLQDKMANFIVGQGQQKILVAFNASHVKAPQVVTFDSSLAYEVKGVVVQRQGNLHTFVDALPAKGYKTYLLRPDQSRKESLKATREFETKGLELAFDEKGHLVRLFDKKQARELASGPLNVMQLYEDRPHNWDAWDINHYYEEKGMAIDQLTSFELVSDGPVYSEVHLVRSFLNSKITQQIRIYKDLDRIDFITDADWHETHLLLKVAFPLALQVDTASYDIQFGHVKRPVHRNTSWDSAKFEVCGHKWADLSEDRQGVALMNDCKYGYDISEGVMRLSLLRSSKFPNPDADMGHHRFTYSLLVHDGSLSRVSDTAYSLNNPPACQLRSGSMLNEFTYCECPDESVVIETIKASEDGRGTIIRLYQNENSHLKTSLKLTGNCKEAYLCNMAEERLETLTVVDQSLALSVGPFEIKTIYIQD